MSRQNTGPQTFQSYDSMIQLNDLDGELFLLEKFIPSNDAQALFHSFLKDLDWGEETLHAYGKSIKTPRLVCWYGDPGTVYTYSGTVHHPLFWTPALAQLRSKLEKLTERRFNGVLGNLYRDGNDSVAWHADKEKELGGTPLIASVSLGEQRLFKIRHNNKEKTLSIDLTNGSLLLMGGLIQRYWRHCVPKTKRKKNMRINLSFRYILSSEEIARQY